MTCKLCQYEKSHSPACPKYKKETSEELDEMIKDNFNFKEKYDKKNK